MKEAQYRNIALSNILSDDAYGIDGKYLVSIQTDGENNLLSQNRQLTREGEITVETWKAITKHFNFVELHETLITENAFYGFLSIDLSGRKVGKKKFYYNAVSQFEIAFGLMVGKKNPFLVEGSVLHIITWFKASSLVEVVRKSNPNFKWKSGYFDFSVQNSKVHDELLNMIRNGFKTGSV